MLPWTLESKLESDRPGHGETHTELEGWNLKASRPSHATAVGIAARPATGHLSTCRKRDVTSHDN